MNFDEQGLGSMDDMLSNKRHELKKEQKLSPSLTAQYDAALHSIYDELYELNLTRDTYRILFHVKDKYIVPPESGKLSETVLDVAAHTIHPEDKEGFLLFFDLQSIRKAFRQQRRESVIGEFRKLRTDGRFHWASLTVFPIRPESRASEDEILLCFIMDIEGKKRTAEIEAQNHLLRYRQMDDERYRIIVEQTGAMVFEWNYETCQRYVDPRLSEVLCGDYTSRDMFYVWEEDRVIHPQDLSKLQNFGQKILNGATRADITLRLRSREQEFRWYRVAVTQLLDEQGHAKRFIGSLTDVDDTVKSELALKYRAELDMLTGIYNVHTFTAKTQELLTRHGEDRYAIIRTDINRFKFINDIYGMEEGDKLLCRVAQTLRELIPAGGTYGRLTGDVFCMCVPYEKEDDLIALTERITVRLEQYGIGYKVSLSFGICTVDDPEVPVSILCDWAHLALKTVKGNLIRRYAFYDDTLRARQLDERIIENEMEDALRQGQFVVYLQAKHDIRTRQVVGAEALVRWLHPREGLLAPARFIPLFERNGFVVRLDEFVWEECCKILRRWIDDGVTPLPLSINVSRMHIFNPGFSLKMQALASKYRLPYSLLELELTESTFIENAQELYDIINLFSFQVPETPHFQGFVQFCSVSNPPVFNAVSIKIVTESCYLLIQ